MYVPDKPPPSSLDTERIIKDVKAMRSDYIQLKAAMMKKDQIEIILKKKYPFLEDSYKPIFKIIMSEAYDFEKLSFMLNMAKNIEKKEINEYDASVQVGTVLYNQYVKPKINE
jgi:hypothetical protein